MSVQRVEARLVNAMLLRPPTYAAIATAWRPEHEKCERLNHETAWAKRLLQKWRSFHTMERLSSRNSFLCNATGSGNEIAFVCPRAPHRLKAYNARRGPRAAGRGVVKKLVSIVIFSVAMTVSSSCFAQVEQSMTVQLGGQSPCIFNASSLMNGFSRSVLSPISVGSISASPIVIVKALDKCSIPVLLQLFRGTAIPVTITLNELTLGIPKPLLEITLSNAVVANIADADANATVPSEKITLVYEIIKIVDPLHGNATVTCDLVTQVCN